MTGERKAWGLGRKLLLQLALIPVLLLAVELAFRAFVAVRGEAHDAARVEAELTRISEDVQRPLVAFNAAGKSTGELRRIPTPFYGWDYDNAYQIMAKGPYQTRASDGERAFQVLVFGGSVAGGFYAYGVGHLFDLLGEDPRFEGRELDAVGFARGGYKQPQQLNMLVYLLGLGWKPDLVINLDGFNEVAIGSQNASFGAHPVHSSIPHWGHLVTFGLLRDDGIEAMWNLFDSQQQPERVLDVFREAGLGRSALLSELALRASRGARARYSVANARYTAAVNELGRRQQLFGPRPEAEIADSIRTAVQSWEVASRSMSAICAQRDIDYVHCLQPTLHDPGAKPITDEERRTGTAAISWMEGALTGYPLLRESGARLKAEGVNFVDGSMAFSEIEETLYFDACHFSEPGHELLAELVAEAFLASYTDSRSAR